MQCRGPIKLTYEICNKLSQAIPGTKAGWKQNLGIMKLITMSFRPTT